MRAGYHARYSALLVTFVIAKKEITMKKGTHFNGQPMYGQLINLLYKEEILKFSGNTTENAT